MLFSCSNEQIRIFKRSLIDTWKSLRLYSNYFKNSSRSKGVSSKAQIIAMFDGKIKHGGLSDRFWGIVSLFKYCEDFNYNFKLFFQHPFILQRYLLPDKIDWEISPSEIIYDLHSSRPIYVSLVSHNYKRMYEILKIKLKSNKLQQHVYTNTRIVSKRDFGPLFLKLFKMSPTLRESFNLQRDRINGHYISCTFRFQQLLGDFKEGDFKVLSGRQEKEDLVKKCIDTITFLQKSFKCPVLVTSDSISFLKTVENLKNVFIINGDVYHPDYNQNDNKDADGYLKSFLDLFMIANADKVFLCNVKPLYRSGFPETAACIYNKPYFEIRNFDRFEIVEC